MKDPEKLEALRRLKEDKVEFNSYVRGRG